MNVARRHQPTDHERGATAVEYALMIALIAIAIIGSVTVFGQLIPGLFQAPWPW